MGASQPNARRAALATLVVAAASGGTAAGDTDWATSCADAVALSNENQAYACANELLETPNIAEAHKSDLKKAVRCLEEIRDTVDAAPAKATAFGCRALTDLAFHIFAEASAMFKVCLAEGRGLADNVEAEAAEGETTVGSICDTRAHAASVATLNIWNDTEAQHRNTPVQNLVTDQLVTLWPGLLAALLREDGSVIGGGAAPSMPPAWAAVMHVLSKIRYWATSYVWRETHWLWLKDSLAAQRVVHTAWGPPEEWLERFGANDCHADSPLPGLPPRYRFSDLHGMRWQIFVELLRELRDRQKQDVEGSPSGDGRILVVELGVFAGHLSNVVLRDCDFVEFVGVDPYIGRDGTFPGNFSETLDADVAFYKAASSIAPYGDRAQLWPMTSEAAAALVPDDSIDAVFIDGCHLYDCVKQDLELWLPKMRRGVDTLIAGHDFSPQWPGVVRAVHEMRDEGREVTLASDWMYWWFERIE
eukprot:TRINITY_DN2808_c0_g1_i1.p1 TRINITY_DN2808_c0_g1~~TRINITY_DN2808_c0_g1_i1.p1  ORF type:complete len:489 (-),score=88.80 TRINITY_DN2808_c0_g1_i1:41-1465(-)